ncbi:hypothetical protein B0H10DRAFT_2190382 [Mycena sp. CBHHK59/15]|nr:hypothetical protein B0H10DRAFT_2190382 [Mycena sp. CBHHK59/15]
MQHLITARHWQSPTPNVSSYRAHDSTDRPTVPESGCVTILCSHHGHNEPPGLRVDSAHASTYDALHMDTSTSATHHLNRHSGGRTRQGPVWAEQLRGARSRARLPVYTSRLQRLVGNSLERVLRETLDAYEPGVVSRACTGLGWDRRADSSAESAEREIFVEQLSSFLMAYISGKPAVIRKPTSTQ